MLERYEIETFLTLAEELHFGRTAERLRVSTGRVSHVVKKLEHRIGAPLFARTSHPVVQYPAVTSAAFKRDRTPEHTPAGRPVPKGPAGATFSEMLTLVAMGQGVLPVGEHTRRYYPRPDVAYVPIADAPPILRGLVWLESNTTARVREFVRAAEDANRDAPPG
ncbi:LysR family transcriptional regulator [Verrucosispora sp. TAA-831]|uniref:helix-turn-helix domain-containing protein n=1 Tax=Verrucosispora sp. TAA-831 TaxID=3422227 RepID=UPI003D6F94D6